MQTEPLSLPSEHTQQDRAAFRTRVYASYLSAQGSAREPAGDDPPAPFFDRLVRAHFPEDRSASILDLGCGAGGLLACAKQHGYRELAGIDVSSEQVALARCRGHAEVLHGDLFRVLTTTAPETLDVVVSLDLLEHLDRCEGLQLAELVHRVLRPGGRWILHTVNGDSPWFGRVRYGDVTHESVYTPRALAQLLRVAGFAAIECFEDRPIVHGTISLARHVLWHGVRQAYRFALAVETGVWSHCDILSQNLTAVARRAG